jgi:MoxR-like ATPase
MTTRIYLLRPNDLNEIQNHSDAALGEMKALAALTAKMRDNVWKVIVGKPRVIDHTLITLLCGGHALIEDVPGTGKTTLAKTMAMSLGYGLKCIKFAPDLVPADVVGIYIFNSET